MFVTTLPVVDLIATGKLRALAVTSGNRITALQDVPSVVEAGFPDLVTADWIGFAVRRDTPAEITAQLNKAINRVLIEPKIRSALEKIGAEPVGGAAGEFGDGIRADVAHWQGLSNRRTSSCRNETTSGNPLEARQHSSSTADYPAADCRPFLSAH